MPVMWPTCRIRKKRPSSLRRPLPTRRLISERQCGAKADRSLLSRRSVHGLNGLLFTHQRATVFFGQSANARFEAIHQENNMDKKIDVESPDGAFRAYISRPAKLPAPAV